MTGQMMGSRLSQLGMPTAAQPPEVKIAQTRNLDIEVWRVRLGRTDLDARHDG
jgi:hypothetical protein